MREVCVQGLVAGIAKAGPSQWFQPAEGQSLCDDKFLVIFKIVNQFR